MSDVEDNNTANIPEASTTIGENVTTADDEPELAQEVEEEAPADEKDNDNIALASSGPEVPTPLADVEHESDIAGSDKDADEDKYSNARSDGTSTDDEEEKIPEEDDDAKPLTAEIVTPTIQKYKRTVTPVAIHVLDDDKLKKDEEEEEEEVEEKKHLVESDDSTSSDETKTDELCCSLTLTLNIISIVCLFFTALFYLCGSVFFHPTILRRNSIPDEPYAFFIVGSILYMTVTAIELFKKIRTGLLPLIGSILNLVGAFFWFIASCFVFSTTSDPIAFGGVWMTGTMLNLAAITIYIIAVFMKGSKPLFETVSLSLLWMGNFMFFVGAAMVLSAWDGVSFDDDDSRLLDERYHDSDPTDDGSANANPGFGGGGSNGSSGSFFDDDDDDVQNVDNTFTNLSLAESSLICDMKDYAGLFIAGSVMYLIHTVFYILTIFKGEVTFSIHVGKIPPKEEESVS